jgi:hypothetical protein
MYTWDSNWHKLHVLHYSHTINAFGEVEVDPMTLASWCSAALTSTAPFPTCHILLNIVCVWMASPPSQVLLRRNTTFRELDFSSVSWTGGQAFTVFCARERHYESLCFSLFSPDHRATHQDVCLPSHHALDKVQTLNNPELCIMPLYKFLGAY